MHRLTQFNLRGKNICTGRGESNPQISLYMRCNYFSVYVYLHLSIDESELLLASEFQRERALLMAGLWVVNGEMPNEVALARE